MMPGRTNGGRRRLLWTVAMYALLVPAPSLLAQRPLTSPDSLLALLASGEGDDRTWGSIGIGLAFSVNYDRYTAAERQVLLDGLERYAAGHIPGDELQVVRTRTTAFSKLAVIALDSVPTPEDAEIPSRMLRIYRNALNQPSRALVVGRLGDLTLRYGGAVRDSMLALLEEVATEETWDPTKVVPTTAVDELADAGAAGRAVLERLHAEGRVKHPEAQVYLRELSKRGFRKAVPPG